MSAIVEYLSSTEAKQALRNMHYRKYGHGPLYLEKAPVKCFNEEFKKPEPVQEEEKDNTDGKQEGMKENKDDDNTIKGQKRKRDDTEESSVGECFGSIVNMAFFRLLNL